MPGSTPTRCRSCAAEIVFVRTRKGKMMPVRPLGLDDRPVRSGEMYSQARHHPHFLDCPAADKHRQRTPKPAPPVEDDDTRPRSYAHPRSAPEKPRAPLLGLTLPPALLDAVRCGGAWVLPGRTGLLPPGSWLALSDGEHIGAVAAYAGQANEGAGWRIRAVLAIEPVPCQGGAEDPWEVPAHVLEQVREASRRAKERRRQAAATPRGEDEEMARFNALQGKEPR